MGVFYQLPLLLLKLFPFYYLNLEKFPPVTTNYLPSTAPMLSFQRNVLLLPQLTPSANPSISQVLVPVNSVASQSVWIETTGPCNYSLTDLMNISCNGHSSKPVFLKVWVNPTIKQVARGQAVFQVLVTNQNSQPVGNLCT